MAEALGSAAPQQLLILIGMTLVGAVFFAALLFYFSRSRGKKSKMKLGTHRFAGPSNNTDMEAGPSEHPMPQKSKFSDSADDLDISVLSGGGLATSSVPPPSSPPEPSLNAAATPGKTVPKEDLTMSTHNNHGDYGNEIDLAARLGDAAAPNTPQFVELLRLLRDPQSGQLVVEIAGQRYARLTDIADRTIGQYVLKLAAHLLAFTNGMIATDAGLKSVYNPRVGQTPEPITVFTAAQPPSSAAAEAQSAEPTDRPEPPATAAPSPQTSIRGRSSLRSPISSTAEEEKPQRKGLFLNLSGASSKSDEPMLPMLNLAGQINDIVQARLANSPLAANTTIEIVDDASGGIRINVNDTYYPGPNDIPDDEVRNLIKASIKEWEQS